MRKLAMLLIVLGLCGNAHAKNVDEIHDRVEQILGVHSPATYTITNDLNDIPQQSIDHYHITDEVKGFYHLHGNLLYVQKDCPDGVLAHEIGHAILSAYYTINVMPTVQQEILCGYVDYTITKEANAS